MTGQPPADAADERHRAQDHFTVDEQRVLLDIAVEAVRARLEGRVPRPTPGVTPALRTPGASFVTLRDGEQLLGCIGSIIPVRPLADDVADNALGAAFRDPRLPPLTPDEFARMRVHISVLTPLEPLPVHSLAELQAVVRPGVDGLLVDAGRRRGTFLPSVWEQLPRPDDFLAQLWHKAGLPPGSWPPDLHVQRYGTVEWGDEGPRQPVARTR